MSLAHSFRRTAIFHARVQVVWSMLVLDYALKATLLLWRFRRGRWKTLEV